jgi:hypothetical protein
MTLLGTFFIPVALVCLLWKPHHLVPLLVFASVFEAGSVFNGALGNFEFGISPFYWIEICIAIRLLLDWWGRGKLLPPAEDTPARRIAVVLMLFLAWSVASAVILPHVFAGMPVISARERDDGDIVTGNLPALQWSLSNLGQGVYLALNVGTALYALLVVRTGHQAEGLSKALRWAVFVVVVAGCLQQLSLRSGGWYPYAVFNNNPNNPAGTGPLEHRIDDYTRISSTFAEPMNSGSFLAAVACGLFASYLRGQRGGRAWLGLLAVVTVLLGTASTTGYIALAVMLVPLLVYFNPFAKPKDPAQPSFFRGWAMAAVTAVCVGGLALVLVPEVSQAFAPETVDKTEGMSFLSRAAAEQESLTIFTDTYGLGVGLGSNRPSSLLMMLLSTVGIVGTGLFALLLYRIARLFPGRSAPTALQMSFWSLAGLLVASMGVPDINRPVLWALLIVAAAQLNVYAKASVSAKASTTPA